MTDGKYGKDSLAASCTREGRMQQKLIVKWRPFLSVEKANRILRSMMMSARHIVQVDYAAGMVQKILF